MSKSYYDYIRLPYSRKAKSEKCSDGSVRWKAWIEEIPEIYVIEKSYPKAMSSLNRVFPDQIENRLEAGLKIPTPKKLVASKQKQHVKSSPGARCTNSGVLVFESSDEGDTDRVSFASEVYQ